MDRDEKIARPLQPATKSANIRNDAYIVVNRADLEKEHSLLIARLHLLRKQLGYTPLTAKEERRQAK